MFAYGGRVSPRRASNFSLAREKSPKARLNSGAHDRTHFAPKALRSDNYRESDQKLGRALLHSAMQQRKREYRDGKKADA